MNFKKKLKLRKNERMIGLQILITAITALVSVVVMFILVKLIGNRAISQMNMFDYINSITIGSIAAELAISEMKDVAVPLTAMIVYAVVIMLAAFISGKSLAVRRVVEGRTVVLLKNGKIYNRNFKRAKMDINEFTMLCRLKGFFDLNDIAMAIQESNGEISFLPVSSARPVQPSDLAIEPEEDSVFYNIILDGKILHGNLKSAGFNEIWLLKQLKINKVDSVHEVFIAVCSRYGECYVYKKQDRYDEKDVFDV